jgi:hypothetical protein
METLIEIGGEGERNRENGFNEGKKKEKKNERIDDVGGWRWPTGRRRRRRRLGFVGGESFSLKREKEEKNMKRVCFMCGPSRCEEKESHFTLCQGFYENRVPPFFKSFSQGHPWH